LGRAPHCLLIMDGSNAGALAYSERLMASAVSVGIEMVTCSYAATKEALCQQLQGRTAAQPLDAIMTLYPLPAELDRHEVAQLIGPERDVDGLHPLNVGQLALGSSKGRQSAT